LFLVASVAITAVLYVVPFGHTIVLISTVVHEMGHGVAAILVGGSCKALCSCSSPYSLRSACSHEAITCS
jgi:hypothetical protein